MLWNGGTSRDRGSVWFLGVLPALAASVPVLDLAVPASSPLHLSAFSLALIGKYLCLVAAGSIDRLTDEIVHEHLSV